jgi:hypothetical protein
MEAFPTIRQMFIDLNTGVPAMCSATVERLFSLGRRVYLLRFVPKCATYVCEQSSLQDDHVIAFIEEILIEPNFGNQNGLTESLNKTHSLSSLVCSVQCRILCDCQ